MLKIGINRASTPNRQQRRSRNDKDGRNYHCGCGKSYLSYTALYTHIKVKHEGKAPEGTKTIQLKTRIENPQKVEINKRGRPRKIAWELIEGKQIPIKSSKLEIKPIETLKTSDNIQEELFTTNVNNSIENIKQQLEIYIRDNEQCNWLYTQLIKIGNKLVKVNNIKEDSLDIWLYGDKVTDKSCQYVLAEYIYEIASNVSKDKVESLIEFINAYKNAIDEYLYDVVKKYKHVLVDDKIDSESNYVEYMPDVVNNLILYSIPRMYPEFEREFAIKCTISLCKWLSNKKYTKTTISKV